MASQPSGVNDHEIAWPYLPTIGFVSGRPAVEQDIEEDRAAFLSVLDGKIIGKPINISIPQYAFHIDQETGKKTPGIIIQAEEMGNIQIVGMRGLDGEYIVGIFMEFELLGTEKPSS